MSNPNCENDGRDEDVYEHLLSVVETLREPATISTIADRAGVTQDEVDSKIEQLLTENTVKRYVIDGEKKYGPDLIQILFQQIMNLARENSRSELESSLVKYTSQVETLQEDSEVQTLPALRAKLVEEDLTAEEMRELRNVIATWQGLETEIRLSKHALQLYDDINRFSDSHDSSRCW